MDVQTTNRSVIAQFRAGGEIDGMRRDRLLLLTTTGRRSGHHHVTPMMFHRTGDRLLVIASNVGAPRHPDWYLNLVDHPEAIVEIGDETYAVVARTASGDDRTALWAELVESYPFFADHAAGTGRTIPLVELTRA